MRKLASEPKSCLADDTSEFLEGCYKPFDDAEAEEYIANLRACRENFSVFAQLCDFAENPVEMFRVIVRLMRSSAWLHVEPAIKNFVLPYVPILINDSDLKDSKLDRVMACEAEKIVSEVPTGSCGIEENESDRYSSAIKSITLRSKRMALSLQKQVYRRPNRKINILEKFPGIVQAIEEVATKRKVGAERNRRTGMLTFGAHENDDFQDIGGHTTFEKLAEEVSKVLGKPVSVTTLWRLCFPRGGPKMHRDTKVYCLANVRYQKGVKGFCLKLCVDARWSNCQYHMYDYLFFNHLRVVVINLDDAAVFRLDTSTTHCQHGTVANISQPVLMPTTDYSLSYPAQITVTSHLFERTKFQKTRAIGVVKPSFLFNKLAFQHFMDTEHILRTIVGTDGLFEKEHFVWRQDRGADCGPDKIDMQFSAALIQYLFRFRTVWVTARWPGGSYLNAVERMNGCLKMAESLLYIPSTLKGPNYTTDKEWLMTPHGRKRLRDNLEAAATVYKKHMESARVCGETLELTDGVSKPFTLASEGVNYNLCSDDKRRALDAFLTLKTEARRQEIRDNDPVNFDFFDKIRSMQIDHEILPRNETTNKSTAKLGYGLKLCYKKTCCHPICRTEEAPSPTPLWQPGAHAVDQPVYPVLDTTRPWGARCSDCDPTFKELCRGHYVLDGQKACEMAQLHPELVVPEQPSVTIERMCVKVFKARQDYLNESEIAELARKCCLSTEETTFAATHSIWLKINQQKRSRNMAAKRGSKKIGVPCKLLKGRTVWWVV
jgi:hypothetical protein